MMKVAFKKTKPDSHFFGKVINWCTGKTGYHHVELLFTQGPSFSADSTDVKNVRFKDIKFNPEDWDIVELPEHLNEDTAYKFAITQVGKVYDWKGVLLNFVLPWPVMGTKNTNKWFCSEIVAEALKFGGDLRLGGVIPSLLSPNSLYTILTQHK